MDISVYSEQNVSIFSVESTFFTSTPTSKDARKRLFAIPRPIKKKAQNPKGPVIATCPYCGKDYRSKKYYEAHFLSHKLKESAVRYPNEDKLQTEKVGLSVKTLSAMKKTTPVGDFGRECLSVVTIMLEHITVDETFTPFVDYVHQRFVSVVKDKQFCLPSTLLPSVQSAIEDLLTDVAVREMLYQKFQCGCDITKECFDTFFVEYVFTLSEKMLHFIVECVIGSCSKTLAPEVIISEEERQVIHYVSGSIIRAFLRKCRSLKKIRGWVRIQNCIAKCILQGDAVVAAADEDKYWTEVCNRGALCFVGKPFMEFILSLVQLLLAVERPDGSLLHDEVQEKLPHSKTQILWDKMVGNALSEDESLSFMRGVARAFTTTYGKGIAKRHININMKKPKATVPLRKRLGAKQD